MDFKRPLIVLFALLISCAHSFSLYLLPNIWINAKQITITQKVPGILTKVAKRRREIIINKVTAATKIEDAHPYNTQEFRTRKLIYKFIFLRKIFSFNSIVKSGIISSIYNIFSSVQIRYLISPPEFSTQYHKLLI